MQADVIDCLGRTLDGPATGELPDSGQGFNAMPASLQEAQADAPVSGDPLCIRHAYVASRAGIDATGLALGVRGLLPVIETMLGLPETRHADCYRAIRIRHGTVVVAGD